MPITEAKKSKYDTLWAEMARRKLMFHKDEDWRTLRLWGLCRWGSVSALLITGDLITDMKKENKTIWVWPSEAAYHAYIEPLILSVISGQRTLTELSAMAGW